LLLWAFLPHRFYHLSLVGLRRLLFSAGSAVEKPIDGWSGQRGFNDELSEFLIEQLELGTTDCGVSREG
jgi:hypothetical protein